MLDAGQVAVFYDAAFTDEATFRAEWNVPTTALVIGIDWGSLANTPSATNEILQLLDNTGTQVDLVNYDDANGFPGNANGPSIAVVDLGADNNVGTNFQLSAVGVEGAISPTGPTFSTSDVGSPGVAPVVTPPAVLVGDFSDDRFVNAADFVIFRDLVGATSIPNETASLGIVDLADFEAFVENFGASAGGPVASPVANPVAPSAATLAEQIPSIERLSSDDALTTAQVSPAAQPEVSAAGHLDLYYAVHDEVSLVEEIELLADSRDHQTKRSETDNKPTAAEIEVDLALLIDPQAS